MNDKDNFDSVFGNAQEREIEMAARQRRARIRHEEEMRDDIAVRVLIAMIEVTPTETPLVGRLLGGARAALHSLVVFYSSRLAARQGEINHTYGDTLRWLLQARERDQETIEQLSAEVEQLRGRLDHPQAPHA